MKKFVSFIVIITTGLQFFALNLFFTDASIKYPQSLVDILCFGSDLFGILFGVLFFRIYQDEDKTTKNPVIPIALFFIIGYLFAVFNLVTLVLFLILILFNIYSNIYRDNKSTINLVISSILSIYSIMVGSFSLLLFLFSLGISRM